MDALSRASARFTRRSANAPSHSPMHHHRPPHRTTAPTIALPLFAALLVGIAVVFAGRFQYQATTTFIMPRAISPKHHENIRKDLLDHAWLTLSAARLNTPPVSAGESNNQRTNRVHEQGAELIALPRESSYTSDHIIEWSLDAPQPSALRINVVTHAPVQAAHALDEMAAAFLDKQRAALAARQQEPSLAENWLAEYASRLRAELADAEKQVNAAIAELPSDDPNEQQKALLDRWQSVRSQFNETRDELNEASSSLARLRELPEPTHGIVPAHERQAELAADISLQADLRELAVNLAEVRLHLLNIRAQSRTSLHHLQTADQSLHDLLGRLDHATMPSTMRESLERLLADSTPYHDALQAFAAAWERSMDTLSERDVDPMSGEILDLYRQCVDRLNDFLFASARHLTAMRSNIATLGQTASDNARHHVIQSDLVRAFQQLQVAHHRFEFSAGRLAGPDNFRLDAARRSAMGLRHRTQSRIRDIDKRLQERAVRRAKEQRERDLAAAEKMVKRIRTATDRTVDDLVVLQERLNAAVADTEAFHAAMRGLDLAMGRLEATRAYLGDTENQLAGMKKNRLAEKYEFDVTFTTQPAAGPINLNNRIRSGSVTAGLVFITVMLGQWWIGRRGFRHAPDLRPYAPPPPTADRTPSSRP